MNPRTRLKPGRGTPKEKRERFGAPRFSPYQSGRSHASLSFALPVTDHSPGNAENADIAASAGNGKPRTPTSPGTVNAERFPVPSNQRRCLIY
jgi:hypothetical protein